MPINMNGIAKMAGVSVSKVSKIMNNYSDVSEQTKARVLEIMRQTGYVPANSAKTLTAKKSNLIGVIFAGKLNIDFAHHISNIRESGYRDAMEARGLTVNREDFFESSGYEAMKQMLWRQELPRAVFAASDLLAIGAMRALKEAGIKTPQDVAIIGCDDIEASQYIKPALSTIRQSKDKIGRMAALMLFDLMNLQSDITSYVVEPELVIKESSGV